jgi:hypothetical protein
MQRQHGLLLLTLECDKAHPGALRRLPYCFSIRCIGLVRLDEWLDELCCNKPYLMTKPAQHPTPVMPRATGLHRHHTGCSPGKERSNLDPTQHLTLHLASLRLNPMHLENSL